MIADKLKARIHRYRQEYLDTAQGREHLNTAEAEAKEVQGIYEELSKKRQAGQDVTAETLTRLLPYSNTKGNKERGVRISTWPCITKDVKAWFEGANWKQSHEWPATAAWLLDISEAGKSRDWAGWRGLASQPAQKGFACGFITPIVHCLNPQLPVINSKVVKTYNAVAEELGLDTRISAALEEYPDGYSLILEMIAYLKPLGIHDLLEFDIYCHWNVAKRLGGGGVVVPPTPTTPPVTRPVPTPRSSVIQQLQATQHDTKNPDLFEAAIADAFQALGFETEHIGGAGEADVVANARLGDESYAIVLDAKTCQEGGTRSNINYDPLKKHQEQHGADFAVVVARAFAQGDTITHANSRSVGLLTTDRLIALVEESEQCGLSLFALKDILGEHGLIDVGIAGCRGIRGDLMAAALAVLEIFEAHQRGDDSCTALKPESVYWMLRGGGAKLFEKHVDTAIQFLSNPLVAVLEKRDEGFVMTLPAARASTRIQSVGRALVGAATEVDDGRAE